MSSDWQPLGLSFDRLNGVCRLSAISNVNLGRQTEMYGSPVMTAAAVSVRSKVFTWSALVALFECCGGHIMLRCMKVLWKGKYGVSNHRRLECLLNRFFRRRTKKSSKLRITGLCEGNPPVTDGCPSQRASITKNVSICWGHHVIETDGWVSGWMEIPVDAPWTHDIIITSLLRQNDVILT